MDYTEMLFAAHVRDFAVRLRGGDWDRHAEKPEIYSVVKQNTVEAKTLRDAWFEAHPISSYIPEAFKLVHDAALQIRTLPQDKYL